MTNKDIANQFKLLGDLMELHQENPFKIKSYNNAYITLRKLPDAVVDLTEEERAQIKGIGKAINSKITELSTSGSMSTLTKYLEQTPKGIVELLGIKGLGPKKIRIIWKELGVEEIGELLYAINENRLVELSGFGAKTQEDLRVKLEYFQQNIGNVHFSNLYEAANVLIAEMDELKPKDGRIAFLGEFAAQNTIGDKVQLLINYPLSKDEFKDLGYTVVESNDNKIILNSKAGLEIQIDSVSADRFGSFLIQHSILPNQSIIGDDDQYASEEEFFKSKGIGFVPAPARHLDHVWTYSAKGDIYPLIQKTDLLGLVHNHSTYSDGMNTMEEMVLAAKASSFEYMLMTDHSKSAFYANGLKEDRLFEQWAEIDAINAKHPDFKLLKGIECDILNDGSLDYEDEILKQFDAVIISVHANLRMDEEKATNRILKAIENPYSNILGHPTGRLLLSRKGYPIDHKKIIDACAANRVQIELNANPWRLDLDPAWIPYAMEKGVKISINPDAHSVKGIDDVKYGVLAAQSGGLTKEACLNTRGLEDFLSLLEK
ncbi:MAG: PHP domain-containing protein [Saprospiraceae bacterium]|nr:PHP domain-containing protein [Saprospiraceae bacterium]